MTTPIRKKRSTRPRPTIGWREWVQLEEIAVPWVKCKVDTGARSSCLHAFNTKIFEQADGKWIRFSVHPLQRDRKTTNECLAKIVEFRKIRSSNGQVELRPVIETQIRLMDQVWTTELTLSNRDQMGFRMLLGRESVKGRFLIDTARSYCSAVPEERKRKT